MRYLRQQNINKRAPYDQRLYVDITDSVVMGSTNNVLVPKGTTSNRPVAPVEGMMRYNTTTHEMEIYQGSSSSWRAIRFKEATQITQQSLGNIDGYTVYYGPLSSAYNSSSAGSSVAYPTATSSDISSYGGQNILVFIENVFQVFNTNYTIATNPTASVATTATANSGTNILTFTSTASIPQGSVVTGSGSLPANVTATVTSATQVTLSSNLTGTITSGTTLTFTAASGAYLQFVVDAYYVGLIGKPVIALIGFDQ